MMRGALNKTERKYPIRRRLLAYCEKCKQATDHEIVEYGPGVKAQKCSKCGKTSGDME
jgi:DNA replicative helicase MCM subunit Mcm2 (Cdc46/Mcm family)